MRNTHFELPKLAYGDLTQTQFSGCAKYTGRCAKYHEPPIDMYFPSGKRASSEENIGGAAVYRSVNLGNITVYFGS